MDSSSKSKKSEAFYSLAKRIGRPPTSALAVPDDARAPSAAASRAAAVLVGGVGDPDPMSTSRLAKKLDKLVALEKKGQDQQPRRAAAVKKK